MDERLIPVYTNSKKDYYDKWKKHFLGVRLREATFDKDLFIDTPNPLRESALRYVNEWQNNRENGHSLLLYGDVGVGKSFFGACILNAILERDINDLSRLERKIHPMYLFVSNVDLMQQAERQAFLAELPKYDFIFIDEFDPVMVTRGAVSFLVSLFDTIYERKIPFVLTTNESPQSMKQNMLRDDRYTRIYDRIVHQCAKYGFITNTVSVRKELTKIEREKNKAL